MSSIRREWLFSIVIAIICIGLCFLDLSQIPQSTIGLHCRGLITAVDNSRVRVNLIVRTEHQFSPFDCWTGLTKGRRCLSPTCLPAKWNWTNFMKWTASYWWNMMSLMVNPATAWPGDITGCTWNSF